MLGAILLIQPRTSSGRGNSREQTIMEYARDIQQKLPEKFDITAAQKAYPISYEESMNVVLIQELTRYNKLLGVIKTSLKDLDRAVRGEMVMSTDLEELANSMFDGRVPESWSNAAYPSLKNLGNWVNDLLARLRFFTKWVANGLPAVLWISGFFFTQSFLTGSFYLLLPALSSLSFLSLCLFASSFFFLLLHVGPKSFLHCFHVLLSRHHAKSRASEWYCH